MARYTYEELRPAIEDMMFGENPNITAHTVETADGPADVAIKLLPPGALDVHADFGQYDIAVGIAHYRESDSLVIEGHYHDFDEWTQTGPEIVHSHQAPCVLLCDDKEGMAAAHYSGQSMGRPMKKDMFASITGRVMGYLADTDARYDILNKQDGPDAEEMRRVALIINGCDTQRSLQQSRRGLFLSQALARAMDQFVEL